MGFWAKFTGTTVVQQPELPRPVEPTVVSVHRGAFLHAQCVHCGWEGPGRRSHGAMQRDHAGHLEGCPGRADDQPPAATT